MELTRIEDRLTLLHQQRDTANGRLGEWLGPSYPIDGDVSWQQATAASRFVLAEELPPIEPIESDALESPGALDEQLLGRYLLNHPAIRSLENKIEVEQTGISLAR